MDSLYKTYETVVTADEAIATAAFREVVGSKGVSSEWRVADGYVDEVVRAEARTADTRHRRPGRNGPPADRPHRPTWRKTSPWPASVRC